jgi:hypothetical protein
MVARSADRRHIAGIPSSAASRLMARVGSRPETVADPIACRIDAAHAPRLIARGRAGGGSSPLVARSAALRHLSRRAAVAIVRP